jgi:hypothetical protein
MTPVFGVRCDARRAAAKGVQSVPKWNHNGWASPEGQTRLGVDVRFPPCSTEMKGPEIAREKLQRFCQVPDDCCLFPEIRVAGILD